MTAPNPPRHGWTLVTDQCPPGEEWCPWHQGWVRLTTTGVMRRHYDNHGICEGSGRRDTTPYLVIVSQNGRPIGEHTAGGRFHADQIAHSQLVANSYQGVTVWRRASTPTQTRSTP